MRKEFLLCVLVFGGLSLGIAQEAPERINLSDPNLVFVENSVIPIPLEIFASMDKLGMQDWSGQVEDREIVVGTNRSRMAMLFGLIVSEGFIAVQAEDKEGVKRLGREILKLASPLGVASSVEGHANSIITHAGKGEWSVVRKELDRTRQTVITKMKTDLRDPELVDLVSLGGWLGGTEALAAVLKDNYSEEGSDLLNQPDLVNRLQANFNGLPKRSKRGDLFNQIEKTLAHLASLMQSDASGTISRGKVIEISLSTKNLVNAIYES